MSSVKIALVTGANKGLGHETCRRLAEHGIKVLLGARNKRKGSEAAKKLRDEGLDVEFIHLDVTSSDDIRNVKKYIEEKFGKLDILVNNAGMVHPEEPLFTNSTETVSPKALRETFDVNFFGLVEITQALLQLIRKSDAGRIVNISSILGSLGIHSNQDSGTGQIMPFAYDSSKTAVNAFTIHLAAALKETPIKVNSAHPGWVKTDLGGDQAPMGIKEGALTTIRLATLGDEGPTGGFFHFDDELPW